MGRLESGASVYYMPGNYLLRSTCFGGGKSYLPRLHRAASVREDSSVPSRVYTPEGKKARPADQGSVVLSSQQE